MANYNKTLTIASNTASITQNVTVNDTITVTVNSAGNNTGAATVTNNSSSVCSISSTSVNIGYSFVITANATGTINVSVILVYNKNGDSEGGTVGGTVSASSTLEAPSLNASKQIQTTSGAEGFVLYSNPTGGSTGGTVTVTYQWSTNGGGPNSKSAHSSGYTSNPNIGVGTEWIGTEWTCRARVISGSSTVYSDPDSTTLPVYSLSTVPTSIEEGQAGSFAVTSTNGLGPIYWEATTSSGGDFSTSSGQVGSGSASSGSFTITPVTTDNDTHTSGETATVKLYIDNTFNSATYVYESDTFSITDPPVTPGADTISAVSWSSTNTANSNPTISWSGGSAGTVAAIASTTNSLPSSSNSNWVTDLNQATPTLITIDSNGNSFLRGTTYYFWIRRSSSVVSNSFSSTAPYVAFSGSTITIADPVDKNGTDLSFVSAAYKIPNTYGSTSADTIRVSFSDGGTYDQYRLLNDTTSQWILSANVGASGTFNLVPTSSGHLPPAGSTYVYSFSGRRPSTTGGNGSWQTVNSGATLRIFRESAAVTYSVSASPTSINEGQSTTYTVTYSNIPSARTVSYAITGITSDDLSSGNLSGSFSISSGSGTATTSITLANDNLTDGSETATLALAQFDSTGASTGTPSASVTIADTSTAGSSGSGDDLQSGLTPGTYGLQIKNIAGTTTIIDDVSRIGTFLATATITFTDEFSTNPQPAFAGFDCSSSSVTGLFINNWTGSAWLSPSITRSSNGISVARNPSTAGAYGSCVLYLIRY